MGRPPHTAGAHTPSKLKPHIGFQGSNCCRTYEDRRMSFEELSAPQYTIGNGITHYACAQTRRSQLTIRVCLDRHGTDPRDTLWGLCLEERSGSAIYDKALVGFRGGGAGSRNQACDKGAEQGSPTPARVVHEL